jgi:hypothetical protein
MTRPPLTEIPVVFYRTAGGTEPVLDWLRAHPPEEAKGNITIETLQRAAGLLGRELRLELI